MNKSWYNFSLPSVQKGNADVNIKYTENRTGSSTLVLNDYMFRLKTEKKRRKQLLVLRKANISCQKKI